MPRSRFAILLVPFLLAASPAPAATPREVTLVKQAASLPPGHFLWQNAPVGGPVSILISIPDQKAYVYRGDALVGVSAVSTGRDGNETPVGVFTILQKEQVHRSNLYDDAPMPYMQRLTWDGVAIHAGRNPGFPDSHGCIRVPTSFAKKLFAATALGATVEVTDIAYSGDTVAPARDIDATLTANRSGERDLAGFLASR